MTRYNNNLSSLFSDTERYTVNFSNAVYGCRGSEVVALLTVAVAARSVGGAHIEKVFVCDKDGNMNPARTAEDILRYVKNHFAGGCLGIFGWGNVLPWRRWNPVRQLANIPLKDLIQHPEIKTHVLNGKARTDRAREPYETLQKDLTDRMNQAEQQYGSLMAQQVIRISPGAPAMTAAAAGTPAPTGTPSAVTYAVARTNYLTKATPENNVAMLDAMLAEILARLPTPASRTPAPAEAPTAGVPDPE